MERKKLKVAVVQDAPPYPPSKNESTEFAYLDQVSILPEFKRKGVGTAIFQKALLKLDSPVVAFIVEKPLFNKASIYWHEFAKKLATIRVFKQARSESNAQPLVLETSALAN